MHFHNCMYSTNFLQNYWHAQLWVRYSLFLFHAHRALAECSVRGIHSKGLWLHKGSHDKANETYLFNVHAMHVLQITMGWGGEGFDHPSCSSLLEAIAVDSPSSHDPGLFHLVQYIRQVNEMCTHFPGTKFQI